MTDVHEAIPPRDPDDGDEITDEALLAAATPPEPVPGAEDLPTDVRNGEISDD